MSNEMHHDDPTTPFYALICLGFYSLIDIITATFPRINFITMQIPHINHIDTIIDSFIKAGFAFLAAIASHKYIHRKKK